MSAAVVGVLLDLYDGTGTPISQGVAQLTPTVQLTDRNAGMLVTETPVRVELRDGLPVVDLIPNDAPGLVPAGSSCRITFSDVAWQPGWTHDAGPGRTRRVHRRRGQSGRVHLDAA